MITEPLLNVKELAAALRKTTRYVYAMRARGFRMTAGLATLTEARDWLKQNPPPTRRFK